MMNNEVNPWESVLTGQQAEQNLANANLEGMSLRERLALKKAAGALGSQNYFAGYEGVPGAERQAALKEGWQGGDPAEMAKLEDMYSQRFKTERDVENYGRKEQLKDQNKMNEFIRGADVMSRKYGMIPPEENQTGNAMGNAIFGQPMTQAPGSGVLLPGRTLAGSSVASAPQTEEDYANIPSTSLKVGFNAATGPNMEVMTGSAADRRKMANENVNRNAATQQARDTFNQNDIQNAIKNVQDVHAKIMDVSKNAANYEDAPGQLAQLQQDLIQRRQELDSIQKRAIPSRVAESMSTQTLAPSMMPSRIPVAHAPPPASGMPPPPMSEPSGVPGVGLLTRKSRAAMTEKNIDQKIMAAEKEIATAKEDSHSTITMIPKMDAMKNLLDKTDIGHPELEGIWFATNVLSLNRSNAQFKRLNEEMVGSLAKTGQSQLWNTIVETQMRGAKIPGLYTEPQLNRIQWAALRSSLDQQQKYPTFLEKWQTAHDGTLTGANDSWIDYATHNPTYTYETDARGKVMIKKEKNPIEPNVWMQLRALGSVSTIQQNTGRDKVYLKNKQGQWVEQ